MLPVIRGKGKDGFGEFAHFPQVPPIKFVQKLMMRNLWVTPSPRIHLSHQLVQDLDGRQHAP